MPEETHWAMKAGTVWSSWKKSLSVGVFRGLSSSFNFYPFEGMDSGESNTAARDEWLPTVHVGGVSISIVFIRKTIQI